MIITVASNLLRVLLSGVFFLLLMSSRFDAREGDAPLQIVQEMVISRQKSRDNATFDQQLALRWAPVHYQATTSRGAGPEADFLTSWDYDGDTNPANNWDHQPLPFEHQNRGHAYYAVVESCTHWFITYLFYHARDWNAGWSWDSEHENDMEGLLGVVRKDGSRFGTLEAILTRFHGDYLTYISKESRLRDGSTAGSGTLFFRPVEGLPAEIEQHGTLHPKTRQEAEGHGLTACCTADQFSTRGQIDGVIYVPTAASIVEPPISVKRSLRLAYYNLSSVQELWSWQLQEALVPPDQRRVFTAWGNLRGDMSGGCGNGFLIPCRMDSAEMPWFWSDDDDPDIRGEVALHPARLADVYFDSLSPFSHRYLRNFYLRDLRAAGFDGARLPIGFPVASYLAHLGGKAEEILPRLYESLTDTCPEISK